MLTTDAAGTIVVTSDRAVALIEGAPLTDCGKPGARRGAVLTFASPVPATIQALAGLP